ncbi:hypothetical protein ACP4OV_026514 [Aristida adscensionis]
MASSLPSSPPPPPSNAAAASTSPYSASSSFLPSFMIIAALLAFVFLASVSIHLLLRFLSDRSASPAAALPRTRRDEAEARSGQRVAAEEDVAAARPAGAGDGKKEEEEAGDEKRRLIESLPLFTMASALAALPKSSPDCAVCLSPFTPDAELRLLPACRHAFHAACVDAWLRTTPSCPLCRAAVTLVPHPSLSAMLAAAQQPAPAPPVPRSRDWSRSFRVEIGTVSTRGSPAPGYAAGGNDRNSRTYSLGSSFDYHIDEEVEAVVSRLARATVAAAKEEKPAAEGTPARTPAPPPPPSSPSPPGEAVAQTAGSSRGWLREYVDRLASSACTLSERWSSRWSAQSQQRHEEPWLWDAEAASEMSSAPGPDEEETAFMALYRWIAGV